jgi:hypothetical protein
VPTLPELRHAVLSVGLETIPARQILWEWGDPPPPETDEPRLPGEPGGIPHFVDWGTTQSVDGRVWVFANGRVMSYEPHVETPWRPGTWRTHGHFPDRTCAGVTARDPSTGLPTASSPHAQETIPRDDLNFQSGFGFRPPGTYEYAFAGGHNTNLSSVVDGHLIYVFVHEYVHQEVDQVAVGPGDSFFGENYEPSTTVIVNHTESLPRCYVWDCEAEEWVDEFPVVTPSVQNGITAPQGWHRYGYSTARVGRKIYLVGGSTTGRPYGDQTLTSYTPPTWSYDLDTEVWVTDLAPEPQTSSGGLGASGAWHAETNTFVHDGSVWKVGGQLFNGRGRNQAAIYDPVTDTWSLSAISGPTNSNGEYRFWRPGAWIRDGIWWFMWGGHYSRAGSTGWLSDVRAIWPFGSTTNETWYHPPVDLGIQTDLYGNLAEEVPTIIEDTPDGAMDAYLFGGIGDNGYRNPVVEVVTWQEPEREDPAEECMEWEAGGYTVNRILDRQGGGGLGQPLAVARGQRLADRGRSDLRRSRS